MTNELEKNYSKCRTFLNFATDRPMTFEIVKLLSYTMKFQNRLPAIQFNALMVYRLSYAAVFMLELFSTEHSFGKVC